MDNISLGDRDKSSSTEKKSVPNTLSLKGFRKYFFYDDKFKRLNRIDFFIKLLTVNIIVGVVALFGGIILTNIEGLESFSPFITLIYFYGMVVVYALLFGKPVTQRVRDILGPNNPNIGKATGLAIVGLILPYFDIIAVLFLCLYPGHKTTTNHDEVVITSDTVNQISKLHDLLKAGALTQDPYMSEKMSCRI